MTQECEIRKEELEVRNKEQENQLGHYRMMMEQQTQQQIEAIPGCTEGYE